MNESPEASVVLRFMIKANIHVFADAKAQNVCSVVTRLFSHSLGPSSPAPNLP